MVPGQPPPPAVPLGNLGQPVSLTLESSAKSSCCTSVSQSHSDPILLPLRFPHLQEVGMCLRSHYKPSLQWGWGGVGAQFGIQDP